MTQTEPVRVLIVDDSEDQLLLLQRYFERAGCTVVGSSSAQDAIDAFDLVDPELTVIDLILPGIDGWELAARLRAAHPDHPIAITSVLNEEHYPEGFFVLPKPVKAEHVRTALRTTVDRWEAA